MKHWPLNGHNGCAQWEVNRCNPQKKIVEFFAVIVSVFHNMAALSQFSDGFFSKFLRLLLFFVMLIWGEKRRFSSLFISLSGLGCDKADKEL